MKGEVVVLTSEQTGGPRLEVKGGLVFELAEGPCEDPTPAPGARYSRIVCRVSDVERGFGYKYRGGSTAREQASLVLLWLCAGLQWRQS